MKVKEFIKLLLEYDPEDELLIVHPDIDMTPPNTEVHSIHEGYIEGDVFHPNRRGMLPKHTRALIVDIGDWL